ncbi:hypothetical protein GLAREA_01598 [Glarea lozoyensis ATCC 20868]|uniref:Uncharacterized protein n=1 Tax=Glarea lozoyensis (strain ATCC 20868 / MF5171) TaxID=1116229 RepID=S3D0Y3_GLAL2|nr:uncharacterized protein GLAREA_01598 [Glarea lozoyensis ATCC 20868]EPE25686.1 hypothetical protein GLAREA_01598 [Glarea lozoyensis ATCC 20868]
MQFLLPVTLSLAGIAIATSCNADNCARAVTGTAKGAAQVASAKADCAAFLATTVTPSATTVFITTTITPAPTVIAKRAATVPVYASACSGTVRYSSACSCFGVVPSTFTAPTPTVTSIVTATATPPTCPGSTCDAGIENCQNNENCYCFTGASTSGFCGANAICASLKPCATDVECGGSSICAIGSCCVTDESVLPGVCLTATCDNPSAKLRFAARARRAVGGTAAYR